MCLMQEGLLRSDDLFFFLLVPCFDITPTHIVYTHSTLRDQQSQTPV